MKNHLLWNWSLGMALALLPCAVGCKHKASSPTPNVVEANVQAQPATTEAAADEDAVAEDQAADTDFSNARMVAIPSQKTLPPNVRRIGPLAEVITLADAGVDEGVMLAFITNSASMFSLSSDEIIYLNDLGVSVSVVTAMIQRDQALRESAANLAMAPNGLEDRVMTPAPELAGPGPGAPAPYAPQPVTADVAVQTPPAEEPAANDDSGFYDTLAPYGNWVDLEGYGPVWQPTVAAGHPAWQPYFDGGRWVYTDCGWYWMSDYSWGWAAFHYGRWFRHNEFGWCWVPDNVWGPSWVCWRVNGSYCGWAPLPNGAYYKAGIGLVYHGRPVGAGFDFGLGFGSFVFIDLSHFGDHHLRHNQTLPATQASQIFQHTVATVGISGAPNHISNHGLSPAQVAAATHHEVPTVAIRQVSALAAKGVRAEHLSLGGKTLAVFRPQMPAGRERLAAMLAKNAPSQIRPAPISQASYPTHSQPAQPQITQPRTEMLAARDATTRPDSDKAVAIGEDTSRPQALSQPPARSLPNSQTQSAGFAQNGLPRVAATPRSPQYAAPPRPGLPGSYPTWPPSIQYPVSVGPQNQQSAHQVQPSRSWPGYDQRAGMPAMATAPAPVPHELPAPSHQASTRFETPQHNSAPPEPPRQEPAPAPAPQHTYSAPPAPAPPAPAPSAPAHSERGGR